MRAFLGILLVVALVALGLVGRSVLQRDREAMYDRYARDRAVDLGEAARGLSRNLDDIGEDLALASTLVQHAESPKVAERELHASATIKREYLAMATRAADGSVMHVVAADAIPGTEATVADGLARTLAIAEQTPGRVRITRLTEWYRVFALKPVGQPAVAVAVDLEIAFARSPIQPGADSRFLVATPTGQILPKSTLTPAAVADSRALQRALAELTVYQQPTTATVRAQLAKSLGLPETTAAVVGIPLHIDEGRPWQLLVVTATTALEAQEQTLVRRVLVGGLLVLILLVSAAAYIISNARRTATLQERLHHVARLAELTEKAEKIVANIPSGVLTLAEDGTITSANRWFAERGVADLVGKTLEVFGSPAFDQRIRIEPLGREATYRIREIPLGHGTLLVFEDLTHEDRLLLREKLATAGQLAAGIAHEVGTPLNVARGRVEMVASHLGPDHPEAANHKIVIEQIDRVTRLLQHLLDYVRPTTPAQLVDVPASLHAVAELLAPQVAKRSVSLTIATEDLPTIRVDPDHLQQIMINLVLNALDASQRGGRITLTASTANNKVHVEVRDDGHGIPRELQAQVFDPFFTTKKRGQGTGLGLWVVAQLVRAHAGEITVTSEPERGTTMRVTWPVAA